jgi:GT2 family glycosyltransferase
VGVVVVNHDGGSLTLECLRSLLDGGWPRERFRVVLVDNDSHDGVVDRVGRELPAVEVFARDVNDGFGAACNVGIRALDDVDLVALVNNDAVVDRGWLDPLVATLDADPGVGAACPKILFAGRFVLVELQSTTHRRGRGDRRDLGVRITGVQVDGDDVWPHVQIVDGTWGLEADGPGEWTGATTKLWIPVPDRGSSTVALLLGAESPRTVTLQAGDEEAQHLVGTSPGWCDVVVAGPGVPVVNNVGTVLLDDGFAADRGYGEADDGRFDAPTDVFAWCGGGVLLRRAYLDDVGLFDEDLFLYYEDVELAWRGGERGWRYRTAPASVVHHVHAASSGRGSPLKQFYDERNRLVVLSRHSSARATARAALRSLLVTASYARRDLVAPLLGGRSAQPEIVTRRLRAFGSFLRTRVGV